MTKGTDSREIAYDILTEILEKGGYSHVILRRALEKYQYLGKQDRAFITRVTEGTVERLLTIDAVLNQCSSVKVKKMKPAIRTILRMAVYQILFMDRIPDSAVVNEAVNLAVRRRFAGLKGFVNGVLRTVVREKDGFHFDDWSLRYSMPQWLIDLWRSEYPAETVEQMLAAFLADTPTVVRCNLDRASKAQILDSLKNQGAQAEESPLSDHALILKSYDYLEALEAFQKGWIQAQDVSSGFVGDIADPQPGDFVVDVCGAPGGKSLHIADLLKGTGQVLVRDLTEEKIRMVEDNIARAGFANVRAQVWDARLTDESLAGKADIVIADLPCSGLGVIGRKPDIKYQASMEKIEELTKLQREILAAAAPYVKPGGRLVYSTCTVNRLENDAQADWILSELPFEAVPIREIPGSPLRTDSMADGRLQLLPGRDPCDGFFIAVFRKKTKLE